MRNRMNKERKRPFEYELHSTNIFIHALKQTRAHLHINSSARTIEAQEKENNNNR